MHDGHLPNDNSLLMMSTRSFQWFRFGPWHKLRKHFRRTWRGKSRKRAIAACYAKQALAVSRALNIRCPAMLGFIGYATASRKV